MTGGRPRIIEQGKVLTSPFCTKCGNQGEVRYRNGEEVTIECGCGHRWHMYSGICPHCGGANGYPSNGTCTACYKKGLRTVDVGA